jgi:hypothetical protein
MLAYVITYLEPNNDVAFPDIALSSLSNRESLWTGSPYYIAFRFTATPNTPPQIAVN